MTTETVGLELRATEFFAAWGTTFDGMCDAFSNELAEDCDWDQLPMMSTRTLGGALRFLKVAHVALGMEYVDVDLLSVAVNGPVVHTQRVDHLRRADGSLIASAPVCGVLRYSNDQVVVWKEYFDPVVFSARAVVSTVLHTVTLPLRRR